MSYRLRIPCSKGNLKLIREFVNSTLEELCVPEAEINMMILAVDEVCANRIIHSNHNDERRQLELKIEDVQEGLSFEIKDKGEPFDLAAYQEPSLPQLIAEKRKGGIGLILVKRIMDSVEVFTENQYTIYRLFKKVKAC